MQHFLAILVGSKIVFKILGTGCCNLPMIEISLTRTLLMLCLRRLCFDRASTFVIQFRFSCRRTFARCHHSRSLPLSLPVSASLLIFMILASGYILSLGRLFRTPHCPHLTPLVLSLHQSHPPPLPFLACSASPHQISPTSPLHLSSVSSPYPRTRATIAASATSPRLAII